MNKGLFGLRSQSIKLSKCSNYDVAKENVTTVLPGLYHDVIGKFDRDLVGWPRCGGQLELTLIVFDL